MLIEYTAARYRDRFATLRVGTGDSRLTVPFYERCGFVRHHTVPNYFADHYDHPIYEAGKRLTDQVYLTMELA